MLDIKNVKLRTEQEIVKSWERSSDKVIVSIVCACFNHEKYVEDAIKSFLMQKTNFSFEVLIRDDCSTDNTAGIIQKYVESYPNIIIPIYEVENQFIKGIRPNPVLYKKSKGDYVAICEGDDYWVDSNKLQEQVDYMESNLDCQLTFHNSYRQIDKSNSMYLLENKFRDKQSFSAKDVIKGWFINTQTIMFRNNINYNYFDDFLYPLHGDWILHLLCSLKGKLVFLNVNYSVYREVPNSFSSPMSRTPLKNIIKFMSILDTFDIITSRVFHKEIENSKMNQLNSNFYSTFRNKYGVFVFLVFHPFKMLDLILKKLKK